MSSTIDPPVIRGVPAGLNPDLAGFLAELKYATEVLMGQVGTDSPHKAMTHSEVEQMIAESA